MHCGIDFSITSPGITIIDGETKKFFVFIEEKFSKKHEDIFKKYNITPLVYPAYTTDIERFDKLTSIIIDILKQHSITSINLEGYAFQSTSSRVFQIGEATGMLKLKCLQSNIEVITIPPSKNKKSATGKGNAKKEEMYQAFVLKENMKLLEEFFPKKTKPDNTFISDLVDSYFLAIS